MKRLSFLFLLVSVATIMSSCHYGHGIFVKISDSDHYYEMDAHFNKQATSHIDEFMDDKVGRSSNMSFVNTRIDGEIALDDHTSFYIRKYPGFLEIKLDKDKNSEESYLKIKSMCEGIRHMMSSN